MSGQKTQRERLLGLLQERHPGYHPIIAMADLAHSSDDERLRFDCHKAIAKYVEPELRSIEVKNTGAPNGLNLIMVSTEKGESRNLMEDMRAARADMLKAIEGESEVVEVNDVPAEQNVAA